LGLIALAGAQIAIRNNIAAAGGVTIPSNDGTKLLTMKYQEIATYDFA
jgi:hypothetical protein